MPLDAYSSASWQRLSALAADSPPAISELFATEPDRPRRFTISGGGFTLDFSRQRLSTQTLVLLTSLAEDVDLRDRITDMYRGAVANSTESRQALHTALRRVNAPH